MDNKLTDNEIIKAFEKAIQLGDSPIGESFGALIDKKKLSDALDLINRQKTEIERLQNERDDEKQMNVRLRENAESLKKDMDYFVGQTRIAREQAKTAKSEAIKEFAEKVKPILEEMFDLMIDDDEGKCIIEICKKPSSIPCMNEYCIEENKKAWITKLDNLVKEMTEGDEE